MPDAPKKSAKKVGGLKTWQWAAAGVGTYGIYYFYKKHQSNVAAATGAVDPTGTSGAGTSTGTSGIDTGGTGTSTSASGGSIDPSTGQTWASEGINPITGLPLSTVSSTSGTTQATSATLSSFQQAFTSALRTDFSAADAQSIYNDLISGNAMGARQSRIAQGIIANLETQGLVPAGFVPIIHTQSAAAGTTTQAHTPTAAPSPPVAPVAPPPPALKTPPAKTPPAKTPPAKTPPAKTPPVTFLSGVLPQGFKNANSLVAFPPAKTPPVKTPPAKTPPAKTPPVTFLSGVLPRGLNNANPPAKKPPAKTPPAKKPAPKFFRRPLNYGRTAYEQP